MIRRWLGPMGLLTLGRVAWAHRGSLVRVADLARHVPGQVRDRDTGTLLTEARAVLALDVVVPTETSVRITGIDDGQLTLAGDAEPAALEAARTALLDVSKVVDVRTDGASNPAVHEVLAGIRV